jgi:uncharacterized membrane protein YbaN (DUF454 family)
MAGQDARQRDGRVDAWNGLCDDGLMKRASDSDRQSRPGHLARSRTARWAWFGTGLLLVALGVIGAMLPLMPTTIFIILAAGCFARSSPRLEAWLLDHPRFGPTLRAWRAEGAIPRRGKIAACIGIATGYGLFWWSLRPGLIVDLGVAVILAGCAAFVVSRPTPANERGRSEF